MRNMSQIHVSWAVFSYCGRVLPSASEEVQKQFVKHVIRNFDLLTASAFKSKKGAPLGNKYSTSKEPQDHGKAKNAVKSATKRGYSLEWYQDEDQTVRE